MTSFRTRPSHRKERRPQASWLVLGIKGARAVERGDITMHVRPAKGTDHRKRYQPGQRLAVKQIVGVKGYGDTLCHVRVHNVQGPAEQMTAGQIGFTEARLLGYRTTEEFRLAWIEEHDRDWMAGWAAALNCDGTADDLTARFERRWAGKLVWALRFTVDITEQPRLLPIRSEELYTDTEARALSGEMPALSQADYERHVEGRRGRTTAQWVALGQATRDEERETKSVEERLQRLERDARRRGIDITDDMWRIRKRLATVTTASLERQITGVETRVYRFAA